MDVLLQGRTILGQLVTYVGGQLQAGVAVGLCLLVQHVLRHGLQAGYQRVVARYLVVGLLHERLVGQLLVLELLVELGGLVAGIGQVEDVFLLLRIEHQRVLVGALHDGDELVAHLFALFLVLFQSFRQLAVVVRQLRAQYL